MISMFRLLNNNFTCKELENDEKTDVDGFDFLPLQISRRHLSPPERKMCPIPNLPLTDEIL